MDLFTEQSYEMKICQHLRYTKKETIDLLKKAIAESILPVKCGCGARSAVNLWSHSSDRTHQKDQGKMGLMMMECDSDGRLIDYFV